MTVMVAEDRSMCAQPNQVVRTAWVDIDLCRLNFRLPMSPEAVEKKYRRLLNLEECAPWPPIVEAICGTGSWCPLRPSGERLSDPPQRPAPVRSQS
jgi:hypothetical protein